MSVKSDIDERFLDLLFHIARSIRYHDKRRGFLDNLQKVKNLAAVTVGSAATVAFVSSVNVTFLIYAALIVGILSAIDLVYNLSFKAREHSDLRKRFIELLKEIKGISNPTKIQINGWDQKRLAIEIDEPSTFRVLNAVCHNEQLKAEGYDDESALEIKTYQRVFAQIIDLFPEKVKPKGQNSFNKVTVKPPPYYEETPMANASQPTLLVGLGTIVITLLMASGKWSIFDFGVSVALAGFCFNYIKKNQLFPRNILNVVLLALSFALLTTVAVIALASTLAVYFPPLAVFDVDTRQVVTAPKPPDPAPSPLLTIEHDKTVVNYYARLETHNAQLKTYIDQVTSQLVTLAIASSLWLAVFILKRGKEKKADQTRGR